MTALANLYLSLGKLDACNTQCQLILNIDRNNDDATLVRFRFTNTGILIVVKSSQAWNNSKLGEKECSSVS